MKKLAYLLIGVFLLCSCSGEPRNANGMLGGNKTSLKEQKTEAVEKSSPVKRVKITQRSRGRHASSFVCAILLEDGKVLGYEVALTTYITPEDHIRDLLAKELFILEVGDVVTYSGKKIVKIGFQ